MSCCLPVMVLLLVCSCAFGQTASVAPSTVTTNSEQLADIIGLTPSLQKIRTLQAQRGCGSPASLEELSLRQDVIEQIAATSFSVDGVLAEIQNERAHLAELRSTLGSRRDRAVNLTNIAGLVTGTGLGIVVNAMQFSSSTANVGNGLGVGSGIASTVLSVVGIRKQRGPSTTVVGVPNMLATLFEQPPTPNSLYPEVVLRYLASVPANATNGETRIQQLKAEWVTAGRLDPPGSAHAGDKVAKLTSSTDSRVKVSIDDLTDRSAMLGDVGGRIALLKRELGSLTMSLHGQSCTP